MTGSTDTGRTIVRVPAGRNAGPSGSRLYTEQRERARKGTPLPGFSSPSAFTSVAEVDTYLALNPMPCLLCGREYQFLGTHLKAHGLSHTEYKRRFALPLSSALAVQRIRQSNREIQERRLLDQNWREKLTTINTLGSKVGSKVSEYHKIAVSEARRARLKACESCGRFFLPHHKKAYTPRANRWCSKRCAGTAALSRPWLRTEPAPCASCGRVYKPLRRGLCNACRQRARRVK